MRFREAIMNAHPESAVKSADSENISDSRIKYNRWLLLSIGAWPQTSIVKKILVSIQIFIIASLVGIIMIPCMLYVMFDDDHIKLRLGALVSLLFRINATTNYCLIIMREKDIYNCVRHMDTDWKLIQKTNERKIMAQYEKTASFMIKFYMTVVFCGANLFLIARASKTITFTIGNETFTTHPMACPIYKKIIDVRFSPANEIFLILQLFSAFVSSFVVLTSFSIIAASAMHACGQLQILYKWLNKVVQNHEQNNSAEKKIAIIMEHHLRIFSFIANLEKIISPITMLTIMGCTLQMCLLGYYAIMTWAAFDLAKMISYLIVYVAASYTIYMYCYVGEMLTEQCKNVGEVAYMTDWYKLPHKTARSFVLIILRSNHTVKITAGKIMQLSIASFADIIKTSMAYLNFLRTMTA